jgi:hypothetical protein
MYISSSLFYFIPLSIFLPQTGHWCICQGTNMKADSSRASLMEAANYFVRPAISILEIGSKGEERDSVSTPWWMDRSTLVDGVTILLLETALLSSPNKVCVTSTFEELDLLQQIFKTSLGLKYQGGFFLGEFSGSGVMTLERDDYLSIYNGEFKSGVRWGRGKQSKLYGDSPTIEHFSDKSSQCLEYTYDGCCIFVFFPFFSIHEVLFDGLSLSLSLLFIGMKGCGKRTYSTGEAFSLSKHVKPMGNRN